MNTSIDRTRNLILCGLFTALMAICSWIAIPTAVPFTLQTFAVFLTVLMLGPKFSAITVTCYLILGIIGLPVFAGFQSGAGIVIGPLGGYMLGFYLICLSGAFIRNKNRTSKLLALSAGLIACYALGTLWFMHFYGEDGLMAILITCVFPFVVPDIIKLVLAAMLSERLRKSGFSGIPQH